MTVGILGAGQLGRMLALAGYPLGLDFLFLDPAEGAPANRKLLGQLARSTEVATIDWENVPLDSLRALADAGARVAPPIPAVATAQDRVSEKRMFERLDIPTTRWKAVGSHAQLERAMREIGLPGVIKTRR